MKREILFSQRSRVLWISPILTLPVLSGCSSLSEEEVGHPRKVEDFNFHWKFSPGEQPDAVLQAGFDDSRWQRVRLPHDWSIEQGFSRENTAASTGFVPGGVGIR